MDSERTIKRAPKRRTSLLGFTLVELIVVITILAILATIGFLALSGYSQDAKDSSIKANIRSIQTAITSESAITGNSARYYVVHDSDYALSGAFAYVDGAPLALTGWDLGSSPFDSNYTAGKPNFQKLKLNPDKFKIAESKFSGKLAALLAEKGLDSASASYDPNSAMAAAVDYRIAPIGTKARTASFVQVAWVSPATKLANIVGNFPSSGSPAGYVSWLLKAEPGSVTNLTWALVEGSNIGTYVEPPVVVCNVNRWQTRWDDLASNQWICFEDQWGNRIGVWKLVNIGMGGNMWDTSKIYTRDAGSATWVLRSYYGAGNVANYSYNGVSNAWIHGSWYNLWWGGSYPSNGANCTGAMLIYCNSCAASVSGWTVEAPNTPYGNTYWHGVWMCYVPTKTFGFMKTVYTQQ